MFDLLLEPRCVRHYVLQRDGLAKGVGNLEVEISVDVAVEVQFSLFVELHDGSPREQLGDRTWTKERFLGRDWFLALHVSVAIAFREKQLSIFPDRDRCARDIGTRELQRHDAVEKGFDV